MCLIGRYTFTTFPRKHERGDDVRCCQLHAQVFTHAVHRRYCRLRRCRNITCNITYSIFVFHITSGESKGNLDSTFPTSLRHHVVEKDVQDQAEACQKDETESSHSPVDQDENGQHHQI
ncbi:uncharacterized protein LOC112680805 isoform X1 [Sipha flava]|uniref:Uncharacterized protein LOC112680805 isoform X1 n=2 Tax=Sipha flava TaxID=143950 RepID=A0A8B8F7J1_9HEMI|nr:uncharacterized protein LOC112680805 isoform X1 [Sipha flava]